MTATEPNSWPDGYTTRMGSDSWDMTVLRLPSWLNWLFEDFCIRLSPWHDHQLVTWVLQTSQNATKAWWPTSMPECNHSSACHPSYCMHIKSHVHVPTILLHDICPSLRQYDSLNMLNMVISAKRMPESKWVVRRLNVILISNESGFFGMEIKRDYLELAWKQSAGPQIWWRREWLAILPDRSTPAGSF